MEADEYAKTIADVFTTPDVLAVPDDDWMSHVGWGDKFVFDGHMDGVANVTLHNADGTLACWITIETKRFHDTRHTNLGFAVVKPGRTGSTLWRIAEGYVNGFPLKDILWYTLTRCWFPSLCPREWKVIDLDELPTK